jgi:hypothetical protein
MDTMCRIYVRLSLPLLARRLGSVGFSVLCCILPNQSAYILQFMLHTLLTISMANVRRRLVCVLLHDCRMIVIT